jgi:hypothetical protein
MYNLRQFPEGYNLGTTGGTSGLNSGTLVANIIPYATDSGLFPTWDTDFTIDNRVGGGLSLVLNGTRTLPSHNTLNLVSEAGQGGGVGLWGFGAYQTIGFNRSAGSQSSQTAVPSGTTIGAIDFIGYTGSFYNYTAGIYAVAIDNFTDSVGGTKIEVYATTQGVDTYGFTPSVAIYGDKIVLNSGTPLYFGEPEQDTSWRLRRDGNNMVFERREAGTWNNKSTISA